MKGVFRVMEIQKIRIRMMPEQIIVPFRLAENNRYIRSQPGIMVSPMSRAFKQRLISKS